MKSDALPEPLRPLAGAWREAVRTPLRRATLALSALVVSAALLVARQGTARARVFAAACLVVLVAGLATASLRERRLWTDPRRAIRRLAGRVAPDLAGRALRALALIDGPAARDGTSRALAELHVARTMRALPVAAIRAGAARLAFRAALVALVVSAGVLGLAASNPWGIFEGADVLAARSGVAPVAMQWLDELSVAARPPDYLHDEMRHPAPFVEAALPRGTLLTFRGVAAHGGRRLLLSDGASEVPFVDDGAGHMVARWPLAESVTLRVVARFGEVVIEESDATPVTSIADQAPVVKLEGAPRRIVLATGEDGGEIPIRYEATDDHGLREVHLVLRSGTREERRVLARLDGDTRADRGGHILRATDPFLKKSHAPIEVRVEAKDNDPITGPKWGGSAPFTIIPPDVGEPEALRVDALLKLRDALVDALAWRLSNAVPGDATKRRAFVAEQLRAVEEDGERVETTLSSTFAGLRVPVRLQAMLRGQMRKVREAVAVEARGGSAATHAAVVKASERVVLVLDAIVRGLGQKDTRTAARQLADVADDLALGESQMRAAAERDRGKARVDGSVTVLDGGGKQLRRLGSLGRDLGEIVETDLLRVARAQKDGDTMHGELAARDLAARLREPDPSFGSRGKPGRGGGESGGARGTPGDEGDGEGEGDVEQAFNQAAQELDQLAQDHAAGMSKVEQALSGAASDEDVKQMQGDAKKHAEAVREAARGLPSVGAGSDSWTSKGAAAREHADQMARSLEQSNPADAVTSGRNALQALDEAKRTAARESRWPFDDVPGGDASKRVDEARKKLEPEVAWAEQKLEELRKKAAERAGGQLSAQGEEESKMAERARQLEDKGRDRGALPTPALDALDEAERKARDAAQSLKRGDPERALKEQQEAQRQLEMAREALGGGNDGQGGEGGDRELSHDRTDIPKADAHKGPEQFRQRVIQGLGQPASGRHKDAIRRYAEGLLR